MENNVYCEVVRICTVQFKMHDGVVRTLIDVRHVPDLERILYFLGTLDSQDCKFSAESGVLRVSKGVLVLLKGKLTKGLFSSWQHNY